MVAMLTVSLLQWMMFVQYSADLFVADVFTPEELELFRLGIDDETRNFPEYKHDVMNDGDTFVLGAFGAYGNPASFHNPTVRLLRQITHNVARAVLRNVAQPGQLFHSLFDRMCLRKSGTAFLGESWHRDVCSLPTALPSDQIFGGWVNLDNSPQFFRCVPGSAVHVGRGFSKEAVPPLELQQLIEVPPGKIIIFRQDILHCVTKLKNPSDSYRFFVGFRLTTSDQPLYDVDTIVSEQAVPPLPSGEPAPLFSKNHNSCLLHKITVPWSDKIVQDFLKEPRSINGEIKLMVPRVLRRGLAYYGPQYMYPPYDAIDREILFPAPL